MIVQTDPRAPRVVLVGPPGAGKSTIGRKLARELGVDLYDTDAGIEAEIGRTIPEIFAADGEAEFRRIEERVVRRAIRTEQGVVSLGGGAVLSKDTRALLHDRTVVYLEISVGEGLRRTGAGTGRPLLNGADPGAKYRELMRTRRPLYREVATVRVRTDGRSPGRVVRMVLAKLGLEPAPTPTKTAPAKSPAKQSRNSRSRARRRARSAGGASNTQREQTVSPSEQAAPQEHTAQQRQRARPQPAKPTAPPSAAATPDAPATAKASSGRARRARARRARARAQKQQSASPQPTQPAPTESERT